ncbi:MAG: hypothetical protein VB144_04920 [Clostridia bacterium]|nr:hypothetical protein [Clostridia bacterium]
MRADDDHRPIVIDAMAVIDFLDADPSILPLISQHVGDLHVTRPVFEEIGRIDESQCNTLGIRIVDLTAEQYREAGSLVDGLSFQDCTCFVLVRDNCWLCLTNDRRLRRECSSHAIGCLWSLETLVKLVQKSVLGPIEAYHIGEAIHRLNPFITHEILQKFSRLIGVDL